jgi:excisionase family DNA binding protein
MEQITKLDKLAYSVPELAKALGISKPTAYSLATSGIIPSIRIGKRIICPCASVHAWLAKQSGEVVDFH